MKVFAQIWAWDGGFCFDPVVVTQIRRKINRSGEDPAKSRWLKLTPTSTDPTIVHRRSIRLDPKFPRSAADCSTFHPMWAGRFRIRHKPDPWTPLLVDYHVLLKEKRKTKCIQSDWPSLRLISSHPQRQIQTFSQVEQQINKLPQVNAYFEWIERLPKWMVDQLAVLESWQQTSFSVDGETEKGVCGLLECWKFGIVMESRKDTFLGRLAKIKESRKGFFFWEKKAGKLVYVLLEYGGKRGTRQPGSSRMVYKYVFFF